MGKHSEWSCENMRAAIAAVRANTMTKYREAKVFKVPRTTLHDYLKNDRLPKEDQ